MKKKITGPPLIHQKHQPKEIVVVQVKLKQRGTNGKLQFVHSKSITVENCSFEHAYARVEKAFQ